MTNTVAFAAFRVAFVTNAVVFAANSLVFVTNATRFIKNTTQEIINSIEKSESSSVWITHRIERLVISTYIFLACGESSRQICGAASINLGNILNTAV